MSDDHLADGARLGVFLDDDQPAGLAHGSLNQGLVPGNDRAQVDQVDPYFALETGDGLVGLLHGVAPGHDGEVIPRQALASLAERH